MAGLHLHQPIRAIVAHPIFFNPFPFYFLLVTKNKCSVKKIAPTPSSAIESNVQSNTSEQALYPTHPLRQFHLNGSGVF
jgi:hypothetical protein